MSVNLRCVSHRILLVLCLALAVGLPARAATPPPEHARAEFEPLHIAFHPKATFLPPKSQPLLMALGARQLRVYDFANAAKPALRFAVAVQAAAAAFTHDGERIVTAGADGMLRFWALDGTQVGAPVRASDKPLVALAVSTRGRFIATLDEMLRVRLWRAEGLAPVLTLSLSRQKVDSPCAHGGVAVSPDEKFIAAISCTNDVYLWTAAGAPVPVAGGKSGYEACCGVGIGFSRDGRQLVVKRSFQPGHDGYLAPVMSGRAGKLGAFPGVAELRLFAPTEALAGDPQQLLIADIVGIRFVTFNGTPRGPSLMRADDAQFVRAIAATDDASAIAAITGESLIVLPTNGAAITAPLR